jgi:hypothetical protein
MEGRAMTRTGYLRMIMYMGRVQIALWRFCVVCALLDFKVLVETESKEMQMLDTIS